MVTRVVGIGRMPVIDGRPAIGGMTYVAILCCHEMAVTLAGCVVTIMTGFAITGDALVIPGTAHEGRRGMAVTAVQVSVQVSWNCVVLAGCGGTIIDMTGIAPSTGSHCTMVEGRAGKGPRVMTHTTVLVGRNMRV